MSIFEALMLICFGLSWPISIYKSIKTKVVDGKSPMYMFIVCAGYLFGILHKIFYSPDWIISLYTVNLIMVICDICLYYKYRTIPIRQFDKKTSLAVSKYIERNKL